MQGIILLGLIFLLLNCFLTLEWMVIIFLEWFRTTSVAKFISLSLFFYNGSVHVKEVSMLKFVEEALLLLDFRL